MEKKAERNSRIPIVLGSEYIFLNDFNKNSITAGTVWHNLVIVRWSNKNSKPFKNLQHEKNIYFISPDVYRDDFTHSLSQ